MDRADIETIAMRAAEIVLARVATALSSEPSSYSTRKGGPRPAGMSEERWREIAPTIPGATKPGRWWAVSRLSYETWSQASAPRPAPAGPNEKPWSPDDVLEELGLRKPR